MKQIFKIIACSIISVTVLSCTKDTISNIQTSENFQGYNPVNGDIIFHTSKSNQSPIIQQITNSNLSHCGIIYIKNNITYVLEASNVVKLTRLETFINNGVDKKFEVFRYKKQLSESDKKEMFVYATKQLGKLYDAKFEFSDNKMYCSELVWKIYNSVGIELSEPTRFLDYDLSSQEVIKLINSRYKTNINLQEKVITPVQITKDRENLFPVYQNYREELFIF